MLLNTETQTLILSISDSFTEKILLFFFLTETTGEIEEVTIDMIDVMIEEGLLVCSCKFHKN